MRGKLFRASSWSILQKPASHWPTDRSIGGSDKSSDQTTGCGPSNSSIIIQWDADLMKKTIFKGFINWYLGLHDRL